MDSGAGKCIMPIVPSYDLDSSILNYIDISKKINKSWESFGWHVRASMDAHFPIALRLYTLLQGAQATGNLKKNTPQTIHLAKMQKRQWRYPLVN